MKQDFVLSCIHSLPESTYWFRNQSCIYGRSGWSSANATAHPPRIPFHPFLLPPCSHTIHKRTLRTAPGQHGRCHSIVCLAHPRRVRMVAQQIRWQIGDMLLKDKVLQQAVLPEIALGADMYLSSLTTISDVEVSKDLQVAKVYVSVFGDERGKEIVMEGLKSKTKYVRAELGKRLSLRLTPEVRFILDDSLERGSRVVAILDKLKTEQEQRSRQTEEKDGQINGTNDSVNDQVGNGMLQLIEGRKEAGISDGNDDCGFSGYAEDENIIHIW